MKAKKTVGMMLLAGLVLCFAAQPALAVTGSETSTGTSFFDTLVDKTARGQIVEGTINVVYAGLELETPCLIPGMEGDFEVTMIYTLRMEKNQTIYPFSGSATTCFFDAQGQVQVLGDFFTGTVVPTIFPKATNPTWKLKKINNIATPSPEIPYTVEFLMADFELAVDATKPRGRR
jgi:hypothetical protein